MNFFSQYKDLFEVGKVPFIVPSQRLRLDNDLFIERPYVPTYTQEYSLNSKLRQLKKDYNEFEGHLRELEQLDNIPKRSDSRRKQTVKQNIQNSANIADNRSRNHYSHNKNKSNIFSHYQDDAIQSRHITAGMRKQQRLQKSLPNKSQPTNDKYPANYQQNQKQNQLNNYKNKYPQRQHQQQAYQLSPQKQYLQSLRKQNQQNTQKLVKKQNIIKNKFYQEENNILKQSEINHVFNWKLQMPSTFDKLEHLPETTVPKYRVQNSSLEYRQNERSMGQKHFMIRNKSNNQVKPDNRNKIVPQQKQFNQMNRNSEAMERRRMANQRIDQRREKLKSIIKSFY